MSDKKIQEGLADLAGRAEMDHEVQMARADLYKIAKYAIKLHDMLKNVSEEEGLEGWQQAKITKAADYIGSVYHNLDYDMKFGDGQDMTSDVAETKKVKAPYLPEYKEILAAKLESKKKGLTNEKSPPGREDQVKALKKEFPDDEGAPYAIAWAQHNKKKKKK